MRQAVIAALILAAVVFALLWPEERGSGAGRLRVFFFSLLAAAIGFALAQQYGRRSGSDATGRAFEAYRQGLTSARAAVAFQWFLGQSESVEGSAGRPAPGGGSRVPGGASSTARVEEFQREALRAYARAVHLAPDSPRFRREYAILLADAGRREEALRQFRELARRGAARQTPGAGGGHARAAGGRQSEARRSAGGSRDEARGGVSSRPASVGTLELSVWRLAPEVELQLWERLFGPRPPSRAELPALVARLKALRLGWFELLALRSVYQRAGLKQQAEAADDAAWRRAAMLVFPLMALGMAVLGGAVIGLVLLTVFFVRWRMGRLQPVPFAGRAGAAPLLEAFVLYLFLWVAPALLEAAGVSLRPSQARSVTRFLTLLFAADLLALIAIGYLWTRLRAVGSGLSEVGLHTREWGRNVLWGIGGYVAALPLIFGSAILANWLGQRFFPEVAPPFHPIQALTAAAPAGWARFALLVAVAVAAPLLEELFFRGLLYGGLRRRFGMAAGVIASAAVFSLLHPQLPLGFLPIFVLGAIFAVIYEWRQSLVPGIVMHALNNGIIWIALNLMFPPG